MKTLDDWQQAFNERLKTKTFEQFSLLLFDVDTADPKQSKLLQKILFTDHTSVVYWGDYIEYVFSIFPNRKLQLQRLLNKALEFVDEKVNRNHRHLTMLHLKSAELKSKESDVLRYFQNTIWKKEIGRKFAVVFLTWAEVELKMNGSSAAISVLQNGVSCGAEPRHLLISRISEIESRYQNSKSDFNDGEVVIQKGKEQSSLLIQSESDEEVTETQKIPTEILATTSKPKRSVSFLGKCKRVCVVGSDSDQPVIQSSDPDSMNTLIEEAKGLNDVICNADAPVVKSDLSKYVDEKLLKFDPSTYRKPQKQQDSTGSTAIQPNTGENSSLVATNSILGKRSIQLEELEQDAKLSICHEGDSDAESTLESETVKLSPEKENAIQAVLTKDSENPRKKRVSFSELAKSLVTSEHLVNSSDHKLEGSIFSDVSRCLTVNGEGYFRLNVLGKGGSSCVHRIVSKSDGKIYAYKRVDVKESDDIDGVFNSYANEISLLKSLQGSNCIIELVDYQLRHSENYIEMVLEAGDIDLAKVLSQKLGQSKRSQTPASLNPFFARMVWSEMLEAVNFIHENRIVHGDLKPANFVFVKGHLKLIDFGIAKSFSADTTNIYRESQIGTVNYMAPEAIAPFDVQDIDDESLTVQGKKTNVPKMRLGRSSDIWSLGCILYQIIYGSPPFASLNTIQKLTTIPNPRHNIKYPSHEDLDAIDSIRACLIYDPHMRAKIKGEAGCLTSRAYLSINRYRDLPLTLNSTTGDILKANTVQPSLGCLSKESVGEVVDVLLSTLKNNLVHSYKHENISEVKNLVWKRLTAQSCDSPVRIDAKDNRFKKDSGTSREALKSLPVNIQLDIKSRDVRNLLPVEKSKAEKWIKQTQPVTLKQDMRSILERRMGALRACMGNEYDTENNTESSFDISDINDVF